MARRHAHLVIMLASLLLLSVTAQAQDTLVSKKEHSAKRAAIMSALLPGSGQVYNGKWWKVPIIYAGFGGLGYMAYSNYSDYDLFLSAYKYKTGNLEEGVTISDDAWRLAEYYNANQLQNYKESFRRNFELYCIIMVAWYGLNIVDAIVDGHLYTYDIGDDLSFHIDPAFTLPETPNLAFGGRQTGLTFSLNF
jgi:hypothetical protein